MSVSAPPKGSARRPTARWVLAGVIFVLVVWLIAMNHTFVGTGIPSPASADPLSEREQLAHRLELAKAALAERTEALTKLQAEHSQLRQAYDAAAAALVAAEKSGLEFQQRLAAATEEAALAREQLNQLQRALTERQAEVERQRQQQAGLEKSQTEARKQIEGLTMAVVVAEQEKKALRATAESLKQELEVERAERRRAQEIVPGPVPGR